MKYQYFVLLMALFISVLARAPLFSELGKRASSDKTISNMIPFTVKNIYSINLETAVQDDKVMQNFELESLPVGADHSQMVKAAHVGSDFSSKGCVNLTSSTAVSRIKYLEEINAFEISLNNGMKIVLKKTPYEERQFVYKFSASGGFASLPSDDLVSGKLAARIGTASGIGNLTRDQTAVHHYRHSLEFTPTIHPFYRALEGVASPRELEVFFDCLHVFFTQHRFTQEGYDTAVDQVKEAIKQNTWNNEDRIEAFFLSENTQMKSIFGLLEGKDLEKVNFAKAREFYRDLYSNPAEFIGVLVGDFPLERTIRLIDEKLGSIPGKAYSKINFDKILPEYTFPKGKLRKSLSLDTKKESMTRITFPMCDSLNEDNLELVELSCQIIEARLRRSLSFQMKSSFGVDVAYQATFYPNLKHPWITIQFRTDHKNVDTILALILNELNSLAKNGCTLQELDEVIKHQKGNDTFWLNNNLFWVSLLTNTYLWGWDPKEIPQQFEKFSHYHIEDVSRSLTKLLCLENYSIITTSPN